LGFEEVASNFSDEKFLPPEDGNSVNTHAVKSCASLFPHVSDFELGHEVDGPLSTEVVDLVMQEELEDDDDSDMYEPLPLTSILSNKKLAGSD